MRALNALNAPKEAQQTKFKSSFTLNLWFKTGRSGIKTKTFLGGCFLNTEEK